MLSQKQKEKTHEDDEIVFSNKSICIEQDNCCDSNSHRYFVSCECSNELYNG